MSIRWRDGRPIVEVYDPALKRKRHVKPSDHGMEAPPPGASQRALRRFAERLERAALAAIDDRRKAERVDETCGSFAARWPDDYRRGKGGRERSESTVIHRRERLRAFAEQFADLPMRSITRVHARQWAGEHPSTVPTLRAMFTDAVEDGLADANPFARLGIEQSRGRMDIVPLTREEVHALAELARQHHGGTFGVEFAAMIVWAAYTCMRPGEIFAARFSRLQGDLYDVRSQFNSHVRDETEPKHGSAGIVYVAEPAQRAALDKPRRIDDDLIFRTKRGRQFRQESLHRAWDPVRRSFVGQMPPTHHLHERVAADPDDQLDFYELRHFGASFMLNELEIEPWVIAQQLRHTDGGALVIKRYGHPDRLKAIDRIRRAFTGATVAEIRGSRESAARADVGKIGGSR